MKIIPSIFALSLACLSSLASPAPEALESTAINGLKVITTAPDVLSLPLPKGQKMNFVLLPITWEDSLFVPVMFDMGCGDIESYAAKSTPTSVSGTVYVPKQSKPAKSRGTKSKSFDVTPLNHQKCWVLPIAQTELTCAQYAAVMTPDSMPDEDSGLLPKTGITRLEIMQFAEKLNIWLLTDNEAKACLTHYFSTKLHGIPYVRLPKESEWEFAARGALHVSAAVFRKSHPYADKEELAASEVLRDAASSYVFAVQATEASNPCGVYDMLGNVAEMVDGNFSPEYYFGRVGGVTTRGGTFSTSVDEATVYLREERPEYVSTTGKPFSSEKVGCRFVLGSMVSPATMAAVSQGKAKDRFSQDWADYVATEHALRYYPLSSPGDSTSAKLAKEISSVLNSGESDAASIMARIAEMQKIVNDSAATTAEAALLTVYYAGAPAWEDVTFLQERQRALEDKSLTESPDLQAIVEADIAAVSPNLDVHWENYVKGCRAMLTVDKNILNEKIAARRAQILARPTQAQRDQIRVFDYCIRFFEQNFRTKTNFDEQDKLNWLEGFNLLETANFSTTR